MNFIEVQNAKIGYQAPLISEVNLSLGLGDIGLLVGNNGMGKTTLMKTLLGQIPTLEGEIFLNHRKVESYTPEEMARQVSMVFSKSPIPIHYTLWDLVAFGRYIHYPYYFELTKEDKAKVEACIEQLNLERYRDYKLSNLSDGNLQKAFIGRALVQNTPAIILDEPTTHLDEENKMMILKLLKEITQKERKLILFSSHDWRLAKSFVNKVWWLKDERIKEGEIDNTQEENYPTMEEVLGFVK